MKPEPWRRSSEYRSMMRAGSLVVAMAVLAPSAAHAFECSRVADACFVNIRWSTRRIPYIVRIPTADSKIDVDTLVRLTERSFATWESVSCTDLRFELAGVLAEGEPSDIDNEIRVVTHRWDLVNDRKRPVGLTKVGHNPIDGTVARANIFLNEEDFTLVDAESSCERSRFEIDLGAVLTHEIGHFIGFAHPCEESDLDLDETAAQSCPTISCDQLVNAMGLNDRSTLWPTVDPCNISPRTLTQSDVDGVCFLYPAGEPSHRCDTLPPQPEPYVSNAAFGCSSTKSSRSESLLLPLAACALFLVLRRSPLARR